MTFEIASSADISLLSALWRDCFGDTEAEQRCFWETVGASAQVFCAREKEIQAMLCALKVDCIDENGESVPTAYLYAVCTRAEARGRGLCTKLLDFSERTLRAQGARACVLVPADEKLARFYEVRGYAAAFFAKNYSVEAQKNGAKLRRIDASTYRALREMQLFGNFASFSEDFLRCAEGYGRLSGAGLYRIETQENVCCATAGFENGELRIYELIPDVPQAAAALAAALGAKSARVGTYGGKTPQAWIKPLDTETLSGYWGLSL